MAVRQLAGPFNIASGAGAVATNANNLLWYPGVGLHALVTPGGVNRIITLDGIYANSSTYIDPYYYPKCWWAGVNKVLISIGGMEYFYDPKLFIVTGKAQSGVLTELPHKNYIRLDDRRLKAATSPYFNRIQSVIDGVVVNEGEVFPFNIGTIWAGRNASEIFVTADMTPQFCFYDTQNREISSSIMNLGMTHDGLVYAPEFGVLVSLHTTGSLCQIRIWSLEVLPTTLSAPVVSAGEPRSGRVVTYRVRTTGSNSDPCVGELIDWSLSGVGILLDSQSETDEDGYAITKVKYGLTETGQSMVIAELTC